MLDVSLLELYHFQEFFFPFFDGGKLQDDEKALTDITRFPLNYKASPIKSLGFEYALGLGYLNRVFSCGPFPFEGLQN